MKKGAIISPDLIHRYSLWRIWDDNKAMVLFIGVNPSSADADFDDPTIRRCKGFADQWGVMEVFIWGIYSPSEVMIQIKL